MTDHNTDLLSGVTDTSMGDPLAELVGEGKKFKDVAALAASKVEADKFIEQLKAENAEMRKNLGTAPASSDAAVQALIERIEKATAAKPGAPPSGEAGSLSREDIEKLVKDGISTEHQKAGRIANRTKSNAELLNHFKGDAAAATAHLKSRVAEVGLSGDNLTEIAETNPKMFRELFVPQTKSPSFSGGLPPGKTGSLPDPSAERGKSYYSKMQKDLGKKFWDPAIQQQLFRDRKELGERFNAI